MFTREEDSLQEKKDDDRMKHTVTPMQNKILHLKDKIVSRFQVALLS